ncbi:hypothetical protein ACEV8N_24330, partial [Vibrio parahaemolyticus]
AGNGLVYIGFDRWLQLIELKRRYICRNLVPVVLSRLHAVFVTFCIANYDVPIRRCGHEEALVSFIIDFEAFGTDIELAVSICSVPAV